MRPSSSGLRVAVLGATTADDLGLDARAIGTDITIGGMPFRVIGILQPKGGTGFLNQDDLILIPISAVQHHFVGGDSVRSIGVSVAADGDRPGQGAHHRRSSRQRHGIASGGTDDFSISDQAQLLSTVESVTAC